MHDVVIIGGGHNGLVCSAYLAMAGRCSISAPSPEAPRLRKNSAPGFAIQSHRTLFLFFSAPLVNFTSAAEPYRRPGGSQCPAHSLILTNCYFPHPLIRGRGLTTIRAFWLDGTPNQNKGSGA
jgi:hypothetical protein